MCVDLTGFFTYDIVLNSIDFWVGDVTLDTTLVEVVLNLPNLQNTDLIEGPASHFLCESLVRSLDFRSIHSNTTKANTSLDLAIKPSILEHFGGTNNSEARRVSCLHGGDQRQLWSNREWVFHTLNIVLRVVGVCGTRSSQNWCQQRAGVPQSLSNASWECDNLSAFALTSEEVLDIWSNGVWSWNKNNVVLLWRAQGIIVEVINNKGVAVSRKMNVELEEEGHQGRLCGGGGGKCQENVPACVDELKEDLWCKFGSKS
jgi:hypothetical protein